MTFKVTDKQYSRLS